ncbi:MAG: transporter substrate-binding domain-containing protein [Desulfovibrionaceae bacterium]
MGLTHEEREWLAAHPVLRLGVGVAFPPFQYVEMEGGAPVFRGMVSDYMRLLSERLGVRMEPQFGISFKEALERGKQGEIDVFPCIAPTPERDTFLTYTDPYLDYPLVIINREGSRFIGGVDDLAGRKVATVPTLATYPKYLNDLRHIKMDFLFKPDVPEVLAAVATGEADACTANLAVASYLIKKNGWTNLRVAAPTPWKRNPLHMAVHQDKAILRDILQKGLDTITTAERDAISQRWISLMMDTGIITAHVKRIVVPVVVVAALFLAVIAYWNRKLQQENMQRRMAEERYRGIFNATQDPMFVVDRNGVVAEANEAASRAYGYAREEFVGLEARVLVHADSHGEFQRFLTSMRVTGCFHGEAMDMRKDGSTFPVEVKGSLLAYKGGAFFLVVVRDMTERRRLEEVMVQSEKMLTVGGLAAGMAHEINNPLAGIVGGAQILVRRLTQDTPKNREVAQACGADFEAIRSYVEQRGLMRTIGAISELGNRAARIVASMLGFVRRGRNHQIFDLAMLLDEAIELAKNDYQAAMPYDFKKISIARDYAPQTPGVVCDKGGMLQVFFNIMKNSAQAMSKSHLSGGVPTLTLRVAQEGEGVRVEIRDNGPGMTDEMARHIFEPLYTSKAMGEGTGLGLSVAYFIVTSNHGGAIDVDTAPGKGAAFRIWLPLRQPLEDGDAPPSVGVVPETPTS